jgi:Mn2+/Fe2+ NRAMP family transporter
MNTNPSETPFRVKRPPAGLALVAALGPGLMWCGEYIGSGEVILAPRTGAILGLAVLWVPFIGIVSKFFIGLAGARYTVCTGEAMIDMLARTPGPRNWVLWPVFIGQLASSAISTGAIASAAGVFAAYFLPVDSYYLGWAVTLLVFALVWTGKFDPLKMVMSVLVGFIILGVFDVALSTWPGWRPLLSGLFGFQIPEVPEWARGEALEKGSPWKEILPLLGWAAGGFASQVWYTYWVLGAGYGMAEGRSYGEPADEARLASLSREEAQDLRGWCRVVACDATLGMSVGLSITIAFAMAGAGVLGPAQVAPEGPEVATQLSQLFGERWGAWGANLYVLAALAAFVSTLIGQFAGWPRLLADCSRILLPPVARLPWKFQFRGFLLLFALSNMILVFALGKEPVFLVQLGAVLDGLLLTPLQAVCVGWVLYKIFPRLLSPEAREILRPSPIYALGLAVAFVVFGYFCIFRLVDLL